METELEAIESTLTGLAVTALPRLAGLSLPTPLPPPTAAPSVATDAELEAMFPAEIAGEAVTVESMRGDGLAAQVPQDQVDAINQALAPQGKTINDMSVGNASLSDTTIRAFRVRGADATALVPALLGLYMGSVSDVHQATVTVAGQPVIRVTGGPLADADDPAQQRLYVYPRNDVVWLVIGYEPKLSEIIGKLP